MSRVTVEECVDKVPNRFELVLLPAQRARALTKVSHITADPDNDKNAVIALREIAEKTIAPRDLLQALIEPIQQPVQVDEPESKAVATLPETHRRGPGRDDQSVDGVVDVLTEDQFLRGMSAMVPADPSKNPV